MNLGFSKYQGAGNDFVIIDNRNKNFPSEDYALVNTLCDRHFGIGADGLILIEEHESADFTMVYYNADGKPGSMCGNGSRCAIMFAIRLGMCGNTCTFEAYDGLHTGELIAGSVESRCEIKVSMSDVRNAELLDSDYVLNTGSPHYVRRVENTQTINVVEEGRGIRNSSRFQEQGINVNFIAEEGDHISIRTYERGVEDETLACGTGITASALACAMWGMVAAAEGRCALQALGGPLVVYFNQKGNEFTDIYLQGPACFVYSGEIDTKKLMA